MLVTCATPATAAPLSALPRLSPAFSSATPDYTVRCQAGQPVQLTVDPPRHTRVAVAGGKGRSGRFTASIDLAPGRAVALRFIGAGGTRISGVRCLPPDFPAWHAQRTGTPQAGWYLVTPYIKPYPGYPPGPGYAAIFDSHGVPVWCCCGSARRLLGGDRSEGSVVPARRVPVLALAPVRLVGGGPRARRM
ncbi:MAG: hypothetical protein QOD76_826 [Solirubrobacteraceae bacterium]|nr:hypothetical protein [Solirubrobacteraceae bacterium]